MKNSPKVTEVAKAVFKELMALSPEEVHKLLDERELGPVGAFMKMMDEMEDLDPEYSKLIAENMADLI